MTVPKSFLEKLQKTASLLDCVVEFSGKAISWLVLLLVLLVGYDVAMRYLFNAGSIRLQELEWHLFSLIFLLGAAYTYIHDDHVRLDLFYHSHFINEQKRAYINLIGSLFFLMPFCILVIYSSFPFIQQSFQFQEGSPDPGGLPYRWLLKSVIPSAFFLLFLQGLAEVMKNLRTILDPSQ